MDPALRRRLSAMLIIFGVPGLVVAVALLPTGLAAVGFVRLLKSPLVYGIFVTAYAPAVVAVLSALLFVAGRRRGYVGAGLGAAIVVAYLVANWRAQLAVAESGDPHVLYALTLALAVGTAVISVFALVTVGSLRSGATQSGQSNPTEGV